MNTGPEVHKVRSIVSVQIQNISVDALVDTGARPSCISESYLESHAELRKVPIKKAERKAFSVDGAPVVILGIIDIDIVKVL